MLSREPVECHPVEGPRILYAEQVRPAGEDDEFGIVVVSDVAREVIAKNRAPERVHVYEIMSKPVLTLPADMQARYAVRLLVRFDVSRAVVVDHERRPLGIVNLRDLVLGHVPE